MIQVRRSWDCSLQAVPLPDMATRCSSFCTCSTIPSHLGLHMVQFQSKVERNRPSSTTFSIQRHKRSSLPYPPAHKRHAHTHSHAVQMHSISSLLPSLSTPLLIRIDPLLLDDLHTLISLLQQSLKLSNHLFQIFLAICPKSRHLPHIMRSHVV